MHSQPPRMIVAETSLRGRMWYLVDENIDFIPEVLDYCNTHCKRASRDKDAWAPATRQRNIEHLRWYYWFLWTRGVSARDASPQLLADFDAWLHCTPRDTGGAPQIPAMTRLDTDTIGAIRYQVSALYQYLVQSYQLDHSPIPTDLWRGQSTNGQHGHYRTALCSSSTRVRTITEEQFDQFHRWVYPDHNPVRHPVGYRDWILLHVLYESGMRIGEALGMRLEDVDYQRGGVYVRFRPDNENGSRAKGGYKNDRFVDLPTHILQHIHIYTTRILPLDRMNQSYMWVTLSSHSRDQYGALTYGRALTADAVRQLFRQFSEHSGIHITPHMFRHTYATALVRAYLRQGVAVNWEDIRERLGHSSINTTISTYVHLTDEDRKLAHQNLVRGRALGRTR